MIKVRKQSTTTYPINFLMVDATDHITAKTGLTPTVTLSKNGGTFTTSSGSVSEIGNGWYSLSGSPVDREILGELLIHASASGADPSDMQYAIVEYDPFADIGSILEDTTAIDADYARRTGDYATSASILDSSIEDSISLRQALRVLLSVTAGKVNGGGTTTITFRDMNDATDRVVATVDANGNRSAIVLTLTE